MPKLILPVKILDIEAFKRLVLEIEQSQSPSLRADLINQLTFLEGLQEHYQSNHFKRRVVSNFKTFEHLHELRTSCKIADIGYDVLVVPSGFFNKYGKKFDVFLCKKSVFLRADLKYITTKNPDTIAKRIKDGSEQANRIVLDIASDITPKDLIDGLTSGCERNIDLVEIILFYRSCCHFLPKEKILARRLKDIK